MCTEDFRSPIKGANKLKFLILAIDKLCIIDKLCFKCH